jgi:hypothetical protein
MAYAAAVNELYVDGWRALVTNRTLDVGAARVAAAVRDFVFAATMVRTARAH